MLHRLSSAIHQRLSRWNQRKPAAPAVWRGLEPLEPRVLLSATVPDGYVLVDTLSASATATAATTSAAVMVDGADYFVRASGTVLIHDNPDDSKDRAGDAEWFQDTQKNDYQWIDARNNPVGTGGLYVGQGSPVDMTWSADGDTSGTISLQSDHTYGYAFTATGTEPLEFRYQDSTNWGHDNAGALSVEVYQASDVALTQLDYQATDPDRIFGIVRDNGTAFPTIEWVDQSVNPNGQATDPGDVAAPVAYRRAATAVLEAQFALKGELASTNLGNVVVRGTGPDDIKFYADGDDTDPNTTVTIDGSILSFKDTASAAFADAVDHFESFEVTWEVSFDNGSSFSPAGISQNQVYVLLDNPIAGTSLHHTSVHLGTTAADGQSDAVEAVNTIWAEFADNLVKTVDGKLMEYNHDQGTGSTVAALLKDAKGRCGAWARFMVESLGVQGIAATHLQVRPVTHPPAPPTLPPGYEAYTAGDSQGRGIVMADAKAQGSGGSVYANPIPLYADHSLVEINALPGGSTSFTNTVYDPSYGRKTEVGTQEATRKTWENQTGLIDAFEYRYWDGTDPESETAEIFP